MRRLWIAATASALLAAVIIAGIAYAYNCVDLIKRDPYWGTGTGGHYADAGFSGCSNAAGHEFFRCANSAKYPVNQTAEVGAVMSLEAGKCGATAVIGGTPYGHVGIVTGVRSGSIQVYEEAWPGAPATHDHPYPCDGMHFIHRVGSTPPTSPKLDLAFVIDTTGSMEDDIDAAKSAAVSIINNVTVADTRFAVVDFRDFPVDPYGASGDYDYHDALPFTNDKAAVVNAINGLTTGNGMDEEEDDWCALTHTMNGATCHGTGIGSGIGAWRTIPTKQIIWMTDSGAHSPEPFTGYTSSDVATAARNLDPATLQLVAIGGADPTLAALATETGGQVFTAPTADDVVQAVMDAIEAAQQSPVAEAGNTYDGYVDQPMLFDGGLSFDPDGTVVSYEWDWNGDGTYEDSTTDAVIVHSFSSAMSGQVRLRVTDNDGLTGIDVADVEITEAPTATLTATPRPEEPARHRTATPEPTTRPTSMPTAQPIISVPVPPPSAPTSQVLPAIAAPATGDGGSRDSNSPVWLWALGTAAVATGTGWFVRRRARAE